MSPKDSLQHYEKEFDSFYRQAWRHEAKLNSNELLLNGYPYTVALNLQPGQYWLELGVGSGRVVDFHQTELDRVTCIGVDYSLAALRRLKTILPVGIDVVVADIRAMPFRSASFNLVTLFGTIQAFPKSEWFNGIDHLMPLLKADGRLGFSVHPISGLELVRALNAPEDFKNLASRRFLQVELQEHGYEEFASIEKHPVFVLLQKLTSVLGVELAHWYGFREYFDTLANRKRTSLFAKWFSTFSFGHYWIWISNPASK